MLSKNHLNAFEIPFAYRVSNQSRKCCDKTTGRFLCLEILTTKMFAKHCLKSESYYFLRARFLRNR